MVNKVLIRSTDYDHSQGPQCEAHFKTSGFQDKLPDTVSAQKDGA